MAPRDDDRGDEQQGGRPAPDTEQPDARSRQQAGSFFSVTHDEALQSIAQRVEILSRAEAGLRDELLLVGAPLPSDEAAHACHAAPVYTALDLSRALVEHLEHGPLDDRRPVLVAEARYLMRALRLVAATELARERAIVTIQDSLYRQLTDLLDARGHLTDAARSAIAPGFDPEQHAEVPALYRASAVRSDTRS